MPQEVKQFPRLQQQYIDYVLQQQIPVGDWNTREWEVRNRLTQLALPLSAPRQPELRVAEKNHTHAREDLRSALRQVLISQLWKVTKVCVIVRRGNSYYIPSIDHDMMPYQYKLDRDPHLEVPEYANVQEMFRRSFSKRARSFEEGIAFYCQALPFLWFQVEPTLLDKNWWQYQRCSVECNFKDETLDMWVPKAGIEHTWYTDSNT